MSSLIPKRTSVVVKDENGEYILDREVIAPTLAKHYQQRAKGSKTNWNQLLKYIKNTPLTKRCKLNKVLDIDIRKEATKILRAAEGDSSLGIGGISRKLCMIQQQTWARPTQSTFWTVLECAVPYRALPRPLLYYRYTTTTIGRTATQKFTIAAGHKPSSREGVPKPNLPASREH